MMLKVCSYGVTLGLTSDMCTPHLWLPHHMQGGRTHLLRPSGALKPHPPGDLPGDDMSPSLDTARASASWVPEHPAPKGNVSPRQLLLFWVVRCKFSKELWVKDKVCFPPERQFQEITFSKVCLVTKSGPTLCDPVDCSTPGFPALHHLLEFTQTHVHWVGDAIQPSHPLSPPSLAFSLSQHQSAFQWVSSSYQVARVLELQLQHQSFQWIFKGRNWLFCRHFVVC